MFSSVPSSQQFDDVKMVVICDPRKRNAETRHTERDGQFIIQKCTVKAQQVFIFYIPVG